MKRRTPFRGEAPPSLVERRWQAQHQRQARMDKRNKTYSAGIASDLRYWREGVACLICGGSDWRFTEYFPTARQRLKRAKLFNLAAHRVIDWTREIPF